MTTDTLISILKDALSLCFYLLREGFKNKAKIVEYSTKGLTPPPLPALSGKKILLATNDLHVVKRILYDTDRRTVARWPHKRG